MFAAITLLAAAMSAAELNDWKNLDQLKPGDRVGVVSADMKRVEGRLDAVQENAIQVEGQTLAKDKVVRVYRRAGMSRSTRALIGAGVGIAAAAIVNGTAGRAFQNDGSNFGAINDAGWYAVGVGAGAGLGALTGSGYATLYQRR